MPTLNRGQKSILVALVAGIALVQTLIFEEDGVRGYGWIISFVVVAGALLFLLKDSKTSSSPASAPSATGSSQPFDDLFAELDRIFRRTISVPTYDDATTMLVQRDTIGSSIGLLAVGLLTIKRATAKSGYLNGLEHSQLVSLVLDRIAASRDQTARALRMSSPIPGIMASPDRDEIRKMVLQELHDTLATVSVGDTLRPKQEAEFKLVEHFLSSAPFAKSNAQKEALSKAMAAFAKRYLC